MSGGLYLGGASASVSIAEALGRTLDLVERKGDRSQASKRVATGYPVLDVATGGMPSGGLTVISGAPGAGKTALALAIGRHIAGLSKAEVLYVTGTDPIEALTMRLLSFEARVPIQAISHGRLRQPSWVDLGSAAKILSELPLTFLEQFEGSIDSICSAAALAERESGLGAVLVDPLSSVRGWNADPVAQTATLARLRRLAAELAVPVVVVGQLGGPQLGGGEGDLELSVSRDGDAVTQGASVQIDARTPARAPASLRLAWDSVHVRITQPILADFL